MLCLQCNLNIPTERKGASKYCSYKCAHDFNRKKSRNKKLKNNTCLWCSNIADGVAGLCIDCSQKNRNKVNLYRQKLRADIIEGYGAKCACCSETKWKFLSIDHIYNTGRLERKIKSTLSLYLWLKNNNFPREEYQLLCFNCNLAKGLFGSCPCSDAKSGLATTGLQSLLIIDKEFKANVGKLKVSI